MTSDKLVRILAYFDEILPEVGCELHYRHPHELLIAVLLSAQTTDKSVNAATPTLFSRFQTVAAFAQATREEVAQIIKSIGLYKTKAAHVVGVARALMERHQGIVPQEKEALMALPGIGVKSANVVRAELFAIPEIPVDTHVARIAKRLGFATFKDNVTKIEAKLRKTLPEERYIKTHHQMIHFGRYYCQARTPGCRICPLVDMCREPHKRLT